MLDSFSRSFEPMANASRDYSRQRQMGIGDLLLEKPHRVFLDGPIHDASAECHCDEAAVPARSENKHQDVHFYINSPGGSVTATMAIYDTMQFLQCSVATYCVGLAASGGAIRLSLEEQRGNGLSCLMPR